MNLEALTLRTRDQCRKYSDELLAISKEIHANPEIRFEERRASNLDSKSLTRHGFVVEMGLAGMDTAFRAERNLGPGGPTIVVCCEYDALPGLGHACGHNIIATAGAGAGIVASDILDEMEIRSGTIVVLGCPAEEGGGGKVKLIDDGQFEGVDAALMIHPAGSDEIVRPNLGRLSLEVSFSGKASHASSAPELGVNALDAATLFLVAIGLLRQQLRSDSRIHAIVVEGGDAVNVIPERSLLKVFVRSPDTTYLRDRLDLAVRRCAEGAAVATGSAVSVLEVAPPYEPMRPNVSLSRVLRESFIALGRHPADSLAGTGGMESAGSTDMGNVSQVVPAVHPYIGIGTGLAGHTREFESAAGAESGELATLDGAAILSAAVVELMRSSDLRDRVTKEFMAAELAAAEPGA